MPSVAVAMIVSFGPSGGAVVVCGVVVVVVVVVDVVDVVVVLLDVVVVVGVFGSTAERITSATMTSGWLATIADCAPQPSKISTNRTKRARGPRGTGTSKL